MIARRPGACIVVQSVFCLSFQIVMAFESLPDRAL